MKNLFLPFLLALVSLNIVAQEVTIEFEYPEVEQHGEYIKLIYSNGHEIAAPGNPVIPFFQYNFLEKQNNVSGNIVVKDVVFYDDAINGRLIPEIKPQPISKPIDVVERFENQDVYNSKSAYPAKNVVGSETHFLRGHGITSTVIYPAVFYPGDNIVKCIKSITFENIPAESKYEMRAFGDDATLSRIADIVDDNTAIASYNHHDAKEESLDVLVVTSELLLPSFQRYVDFKISQGYDVAVETVENIYAEYQGYDKQDMIRNCIKDYYNSYSIDYVILVGDADVATEAHNIIPCRGFTAVGDPSIPSDMYYSNLDGTWDENNNGLYGESGEEDFYSEVAIGRICADSPQEVDNFVTKMIRYQDVPFVDDVEKAMMVGESLDAQTFGGNYKDEIKDGTSRHGFTTEAIPSNYSVRTMYERDTNWVGSDLFEVYSENGMHVVNHLGHSNVDYNMKLNASALTTKNFTNDGLNHSLVIQYSQGCYNGSFDNRGEGYGSYGTSDCFAEVFTTLETGHVAQIANSRYGWYMPGNTNSSSQFYDRLFFDGVFNKGYEKLGDANSYAKEKNTSWLMGYDGEYFRFTAYESTLFGDPTMQVWTKKPEPIVVDMMRSVSPTLQEWTITTNAPKSLITMVKDGVRIYENEADDNGKCVVDFQSLQLAAGDTISVNIMTDNMIPYHTDVKVAEYASVIDYDFTFSDVLGNNDGVINYGETIQMSFVATNVSSIPFTSQIAVSSNKSYINVIDSNITVDLIQPGESLYSPTYIFKVDANTAKSEIVSLFFESSDNVVYETFIDVKAPIISLDEYVIEEKSGNGDGFIQQGETGTVTLIYSNSGVYPMRNVKVAMKQTDIVVEYPVNEITIDEIAVGETVECSFDFIVGECVEGFIIVLAPQLSDEMNLSFNNNICYMIGESKILLVDLDKNKNSMTVLRDDLQDVIGANVEYVKNMPTEAQINEYSLVFMSLGVFADNTVLTGKNQEVLINYLNQGGSLYLEGGSCWYADKDFVMKEYFSVEGNPTEESWVNGYTNITGVANTGFEGIDVRYKSDNLRIDAVTPVGDAKQIIVNSPVEFGGAVSYENDVYKTIGASFEYGGIQNTSDSDSRMQYLKSVLSFYDIDLMGPKEILMPNDTIVCIGSSITLDAGDGFVSYLWSNGETTRYCTLDETVNSVIDDYEVTVTAIDSWGYVSEKTVVVRVLQCTGIEDVESEDEITIYPNPTDGVINLDLSDNSTADVYIYNVSGVLVYNAAVAAGEMIDICQMPEGIYIIRIFDGEKFMSKKIIKQ